MSYPRDPAAVASAVAGVVWSNPSITVARQRLAEAAEEFADDPHTTKTVAAYTALVESDDALFANDIDDSIVALVRARATVDQACGILMGGRRCSPQEAIATLVRLSDDAGHPLFEVASAIVDETVTSSTDESTNEH